MRDAMIAGTTLNIFNNHADRVKMANIAQTINVLQAVILTQQEKMLLTPTYHVMKMYNVHQDATLLHADFNIVDYQYEDETLPAVSISASKDVAGRVHITLVNIDLTQSQSLNIMVRGQEYDEVNGTILRSASIQDHNTFEEPEKVIPAAFTGFKDARDGLEVELPPYSVVVLELSE
jgi:alpha-N-arabinofuranosidase